MFLNLVTESYLSKTGSMALDTRYTLAVLALLTLLLGLVYAKPWGGRPHGTLAMLGQSPLLGTVGDDDGSASNLTLLTYPSRICAYQPTIIFLSYVARKPEAYKLVLNVTTFTEVEAKPVEAPQCKGSIPVTIKAELENGEYVSKALVLVVDRYTGSVCSGSAPGTIYLNASSYSIVVLYDGDDDNLYEYIGVREAYVTGSTTVTVTLGKIDAIVSNTIYQYERVTFETSIPVFNILAPLSPTRFAVLGVSGIPPLPSFLAKGDKKALTQYFIGIDPAIDSIYVNLSTIVLLKVVDDRGNILNETMVRVARGCGDTGDAPPAALLVVADYLQNPVMVWNGFLLSKPYWTVEAGKPVNLTILAFDDKLVKNITLYYRVNGGQWYAVKTEDTPIAKELNDFMATTFAYYANTISIILDAAGYLGANPPEYSPTAPPFTVKYAMIPGQPPGELVEYYASVEDGSGNTYDTVKGFYITYNVSGLFHVLVYDPSLPLYLLRENYKTTVDLLTKSPYANQLGKLVEGFLGVNASAALKKLAALYELASSFIHLHHWEKLAKYYRLSIITNPLYLPQALKLLAPRVVIISNAWLGFNESIAPWFTNWDLSRHGMLGMLLGYIRRVHGGLIVTHASLFDMVLWGKGQRLAIGAATQSRILAGALGLPLTRLYQELRDAVARAYVEAGLELGYTLSSTPVLVPYVPWDGRLIVTREARRIGFTNATSLDISIPGPYEELGYEAYTSVGWQLGWPLGINVSSVLSRTLERLEKVESVYKQLFSSALGALGAPANIGSVLYSAPKLLEMLYNLSSSAVYEASGGELVARVNLTLPTGRETLDAMLPPLHLNNTILSPVKLIAVSPDGLAGVIAYDRYWDLRGGYRAVYISFEIEASGSSAAWELLRDATRWAASWKPLLVSSPARIAQVVINAASGGQVGRLLGEYKVSRIIGGIVSRAGATYAISVARGVSAILAYNATGVELEKIKGGDLLATYTLPHGFKLILVYTSENATINVTLRSPAVEPVALAILSSTTLSKLSSIMPELQKEALDAIKSLGERYYSLADGLLVRNETIVEYKLPYRRIVVALAFNESLDVTPENVKHFIVVENYTPEYLVGAHSLVVVSAYLEKNATLTLILRSRSSGLGEPVYLALRSVPAADINLDGKVDVKDFSILKQAYGAVKGSKNYNWLVDINCDGVIDYKDLAILAAHYGEKYER